MEDSVQDFEELWSRCADSLRSQVSVQVWEVYLSRLTPLSFNGSTLDLAVPNQIVRGRIVDRFLPLITDALAETAGTPVEVTIKIQEVPGDNEPVEQQDIFVTPPPVIARDTSRPQTRPSPVAREGGSVKLDPRFTFESFVSASSNRLAFAAAQTVAETPGRSYNPLFIYGASGLGKTHLLHAIGNYILENYRNHSVLYVTTETFLNDFVDAMRLRSTLAFKRHYRECDVLLIDDVQFMQNKEGLQEELFHTYNDLHQAGKQIVLTSDRPPKSIETLEDRLRSRLLSGLLAEIDPPDLETRLAILRTKAELERTYVPDDVLEFIATHVKDNIRELEGALIRVTAFASLNQEVVSLDVAERVLGDIVSAGEPRVITPEMILQATAKTYGFTVEEIIGPRRARPLVTARHVAMYLMRNLTEFSYPAIGRIFGGRDHTTCINAFEKIANQMGERRQIYEQVTSLILEIKQGA